MAVTDVGVGAGGLGKVVAGAILQFNKSAVAPPLINMVACPPGTNVAQVPVYSKQAITDVTNSASGAEETSGSAISVTSTATSLEVLRNNVYAEVTDLVTHGNSDAFLVNAGSVLGNAVSAEFDNHTCLLLDTFSATVGGSTTHNSLSLLFNAVATLEGADAPRPYSSIYHPLQVFGSHGITEDLGSNGGQLSSGPVANALQGPGFATTIGGVDIYTSPQVVATSDQHKGGVFAKTAISCGYIDQGGGSFIQVETDRNAPNASTYVVANGYWEIAVTVNGHGVEVHTETA